MDTVYRLSPSLQKYLQVYLDRKYWLTLGCHPHLFAMDFSAVASPTAKVQRGVVSQTHQAGGTMHPTLR
jgi:hypothetical protein